MKHCYMFQFLLDDRQGVHTSNNYVQNITQNYSQQVELVMFHIEQ
jgi:hypothetical protein